MDTMPENLFVTASAVCFYKRTINAQKLDMGLNDRYVCCEFHLAGCLRQSEVVETIVLQFHRTTLKKCGTIRLVQDLNP